MEKRIVGLGVIGGLAAGVVTFGYARLQLAPLITAAVDHEAERAHAEEALGGGHSHEHEVFSRAIQENVGSAVGTIAFGVVIGALFAVALTIVLAALKRHGVAAGLPVVAASTAAAGFVTVALVPFLAYPANPPGVGQAETAGDRTTMYLVVVVASLAAAAVALTAGLRLTARIGAAPAVVVSGAGYLVAMAAVVAALPSFSEVPAGFPADVLADFRISSLVGHALLWSVLGAVFAVFLPRLLTSARELGVAHAGR
jgi:hypothetical protein